MIVSHKHQMMFFHCRKTGGSAIKLNLYPHLGDEDIVIGGLSEILEDGYKLNKAARRSLNTPSGAAHYWGQRLRGVAHAKAANHAIKKVYRNLSNLPEHARGREVAANFPREFETYWKFAFIRNPFTQVVSDYFWRQRVTGNHISFSSYLDLLLDDCDDNITHRTKVKNFDIISHNGQVACNFVGRYENIDEDFDYVAGKLGIDCHLVRSSKSGQRAQDEYATLYLRGDREKVQKLFWRDLELFDYDWPF